MWPVDQRPCMVVQQVAVDATLIRNGVVLLGLLAVFVYILVSSAGGW
jgi:hypothetical protein